MEITPKNLIKCIQNVSRLDNLTRVILKFFKMFFNLKEIFMLLTLF